MAPQTGFSRAGRVYLWSVIGAGSAVLIGSIYRLSLEPLGAEWFILAALTLISGSATVRLPSTYASISISETFVFTAVLLYGPAAGTVIVALDGLVGSFWISKRHNEIHRPLFNMSAPVLSAWCSANLFFSVAGIAPLVKQPSPDTAILPPLVLFALTYFGLNSWLITFVISLEKKLDPLKVWKSSFGWLSLNYFGGASVAFLLVGYNRTINLGYIGAIIPLLLVLYFTFNAAMGRVEDADRHVEQLNKLYLSTIETLAMAIDAKDQVTHGHIRRVQTNTTALALAVGVRDDKLLNAIQAAALLHDMGKLAVPEYILNKPGKLTDAEFEKMKLHASVGADILSAIEFPYPVVPIVRHHHENWDGTGYPSGIKGTDIPIGARILAVVDCFDALTSDRPYRPKMSDEQALAILIDRRGSMYDPLIVDTFISVHSTTAREIPQTGPANEVLNTITHSRRSGRVESGSPEADFSSSADEMLSVCELTAALAGHVNIADAGDVIGKHLRRLIPASTCVFFMYDSSADELKAEHVVGDAAASIRGLAIGLGQRLSGWVAANRQTICNSDADLDLRDVARTSGIELRSAISTPLIANDQLLGVLTLYSTETHAFSEDHRRIIEVVSRQIAHTFHRTLEVNGAPRRDSLTGLPHVEQLDELMQSLIESNSLEQRHSLLFVDVSALKQINADYGRASGDEVLKHVVRHIRAGLRVADILFRNSGDDFVAFLAGADVETAELVASRVRERIGRSPVAVLNGQLFVDARVTVVSSPRDGIALKELFRAAKHRRSRHCSSDESPSVH